MPPQSRGERKKWPIAAPPQYDRTNRPIKRSQKLSNQPIVRGSLTMFDSFLLPQSTTAREFTRFTANPFCGPVIAPASCSADAAV
jgi:hypothetical protein